MQAQLQDVSQIFKTSKAVRPISVNTGTPETVSNGNSINQKPNETKTNQTGVIQPGVYLTFSTLPGGGNELECACFRHFTEEQAEIWCRAKGCKQHDVLAGE